MNHRIFLVEDHPVFRRTHAQVIEHAPGLEFCGEARSGEEALEKIQISIPDLVLLDISLPGMSGIDLARHLERDWPKLPLLIVSGHPKQLYFHDEFNAVESNIKGYVMKEEGPKVLLQEIERVLNDGAIK